MIIVIDLGEMKFPLLDDLKRRKVGTRVGQPGVDIASRFSGHIDVNAMIGVGPVGYGIFLTIHERLRTGRQII